MGRIRSKSGISCVGCKINTLFLTKHINILRFTHQVLVLQFTLELRQVMHATQRARVPHLDTTNPVGWFGAFIAVASTLGCGLAFSADKIDDMHTNEFYIKVKEEKPHAKDHAAYDLQRDRKKDAEKALDANRLLAGYLRVACLQDPAALRVLKGAIGMFGQDGVKALQALWGQFGPKSRLFHTQKAFQEYVHPASESIGSFIVTMDNFFEWLDLGGMKLTLRRKCEMALQKVHEKYRLTMLSTCSAYTYSWDKVKIEFEALHDLNSLLSSTPSAHAASTSSTTCKHCGKVHPSDSCINEPGISPAEKNRRYDAWKAYRKKKGIWFEKDRTVQARLASIEAHEAQHGHLDSQTEAAPDTTTPFAGVAMSHDASHDHEEHERHDPEPPQRQAVSLATEYDESSGSDDGGAETTFTSPDNSTIGAHAASLLESTYVTAPTGNGTLDGHELSYRHAPQRRYRIAKPHRSTSRDQDRPAGPQPAWRHLTTLAMTVVAVLALFGATVLVAGAMTPVVAGASPAQGSVHVTWGNTTSWSQQQLPNYEPAMDHSRPVIMHAHAATARSRAKKRARAHVGSTLDLCPDSGASHHFFNNPIYFKSLRQVRGQRVKTANGTANIVGVGEVDMHLTRSDGAIVVITIEAYYAPTFTKPLLSISKLVDAGHSVVFDVDRRGGCGMRVGNQWVPIMCRGGNYSFNAPAAMAASTPRARVQASVRDGGRVYARPRGRSPRGKVWSKQLGKWVARTQGSGSNGTSSGTGTNSSMAHECESHGTQQPHNGPGPNSTSTSDTEQRKRTGRVDTVVDVEADATRPADTDAQSKRTEPNGTDAQSKRTEPCGKGHSWWHSVLVHINDTDCCAAVRRGRITGVPQGAISGEHESCRSCAATKSRKAQRSRDAMTPASAAYDTADVDICEVDEPDHSGHRFVVTITDRHTRYRWSKLLKAHKDSPGALREFHHWVVSEGHRPRDTVMELHGDGEFMKGEFAATAKELGMRITGSPPYCQWGNGVAENTFRTLMAGTRALLHHARLPSTFWGLAYMHVTDVRNLVGSAHSEYVSPHEALHGSVPDVTHLLPFGQIVAAHVDAAQRSKLEPTSRFGIYVGRAHGYTSSSIRVYMPDTQRVVVTAEYKVMLYPDDGTTTMRRWRRLANSAADSFPPDEPCEHTNVGDAGDDDVREPQATIRASDGSEGKVVGKVQRGGQEFVKVKYTDGSAYEYDAGDVHDQLQHDVEPNWCETPRDGMTAREVATEMFKVNPTLYCEFLKDYEWKDRHGRAFTCRGPRTRFVKGSKMPDPRNHPSFMEIVAEYDSSNNNSGEAEATAFKAMLNPIANPTFDEAMAGPDRDEWIAAMEEHALSLGGLGTFGPPMSKDQCPKRPIKGRWVLVIKDDGRYKARWVTQGFRQKEGIDFDANKCHADVARMASIRTVIALAAVQNATVSALDIKDFYVTTPIDTDMYVQLPHIPGHDYSSGDHARLRKCLFGMRQSGRLAADKLDTVMTKMGFTQLKTDPCIYTREGIHVAVFVDDLLLATANDGVRSAFITEFETHFAIRDYPDISSYLGMQIKQDETGIEISMPGYVEKLLQATGMSDCNSQSTPGEKGLRLSREDEAAPAEYQLNGQTYRTVCGSLLWCALACRPDISANVSMLCRHVARPTKKSWEAAKRVIRYLKGTADRGIKYGRTGELMAYSDASWGDDESARSTTGFCILLGGAAIDWKSRLQSTVAQSTCEAECLAMAECVTEVTYVRSLVRELGVNITEPTPVHVDNKGAVDDSHNKSGRRTRHINIKFHAVREAVCHGEIRVIKVSGGVNADSEQLGDVFTKSTSRAVHEALVPQIMGETQGKHHQA